MSRSTISASRCLLVLALALLAGCGPNTVKVEGHFPPPLMDALPIRLGVWYPEEFRNHEIFDEARSRSESDWVVQTGTAQVAMWNSLLQGMFIHFVPLQEAPAKGKPIPGVDAVLIPHVDELQYAIPQQTHIKVYEIWMRYRFELLDDKGESLVGWTMPAYGKTPTAFLRSDEDAVNLAAVMALRDAGANFAMTFPGIPEVAALMGVPEPKPDEAAHGELPSGDELPLLLDDGPAMDTGVIHEVENVPVETGGEDTP
ncbi:hypothetical protein [Haliea sp. E17]|uniref:hypothetical protein n=1 Tax=Haliea sp. E17 TaxID=3401576 RepID=UPI003AACE27E